MVHMAIKVKKQLKKKGAVHGYSTASAPKWNPGPCKNVPTSQSKEPAVSMKSNKYVAESSKGKAPENVQSRSRDIKCFKCQGRGHIASQCSNRNMMIFAVEGEMLIVKRSLNAQNSISEPQRENLFHTRCHVLGKVCSVVIDGGSCTNVTSTLIIKKLALSTFKHPSPYKLQWLNEGVELKVTKQARISFSIRNYHDEVICDVVPMHAGHLLLGRPWQFDWQVKHDSFANQYSFKHKGKNIVLAPLSPQQVMDDQQCLKQSMESLKEKNKEIEIEKEKEKGIEKGFEEKIRARKKEEKKRKVRKRKKKKKVNFPKELQLHYISEERRFVLRQNGKSDPKTQTLEGKQGLISENFKTSLFCSTYGEICNENEFGAQV
ncbi:mutant gag-pol polyprotein [Gossypium australe]|uniref:Mutant gag-pol polyprotein n=1 Tax=Gossypium australe TaxID=47621 RepID=A0A5B6WID5_9ROSI|nr:mutant gag-pol polyprotein [Gossypium australe]